MSKIRVVLSGIFYPMAILRYFERALQRREDVELITVGPYTGTFIPWGRGMNLKAQYAKSPDRPLSSSMIGVSGTNVPAPEDVDLWIQVDAGFYFKKPKAKVVAHVATDPHVLNYDKQRGECDYFFNMQKVYSKPGDIYLPYAADPEWHSPMDLEKEWDACLIGLQYENRTRLVEALRAEGLRVYYDNGPAFREYQLQYAKSRVALSWSSKQDLIARVFEGMCMKLPVVCNRVPDINEHFMEGKHLSCFDNLGQAVAAVQHLLLDEHYSKRLADESHDLVMKKHLYDHRIQQILETVGLI